jgi:hypothetical protein
MQPIKITPQNLPTVYGWIKKHLALMESMLDVIILEDVHTYKEAVRLMNTQPGLQTRNDLALDRDSIRVPWNITIGNEFELDQLNTEFICAGDQIWINSQGIFIKTWRGLRERYQFIVVKGKRGIVEILTYSKKQLHCMADRSEKWENDSTIALSFYGELPFTDRRRKGEEPSPWKDSEIIYKGVVHDYGISVKEMNIYEVYKDTEPEGDDFESSDEIPSRFSGRVRQFLTGTGDW